MKIDGHDVTPVDTYRAITWATTFAIKEAISAGQLSPQLALSLIERMNIILGWLVDNKIVMFNDKTGLFEPHDVNEATEEADDLSDPDVLVIKGGQ